MSRLNQINANDYPSQEKIHEDFDRLYRFLQSTERGGLTLTEQLDKILDTGGAVSPTFAEFRWDTDEIQYRLGGGAWLSLGVGLAELQGPAGPSGAGTGDMVRATYDPDDDGKIAYPQLNLADDEVPQVKITGLEADLLARARVIVSPTVPGAPTFPPAGPLTIWIDTSGSTPVWNWWDGTGEWRTLTGGDAGSGTSTVAGTVQIEAGEAIANRDVVFFAEQHKHATGTDLATGGTAFASGGTAGNAFDGSTGTSCSTGSATGHVGYQKSGLNVGLVELYFAAGSQTHALVFETSTDGASYDTRLTVSVATYDGDSPSYFVIPTPEAAEYFRIRQTGGGSNLTIRSMKLYGRSFSAGKLYKWDDDATNPDRRGLAPGIALGAVASGVDVRVQYGPNTLTGMSGLTADTAVFTGTTAGGVTTTPGRAATYLGVPTAADTLEFTPAAPRYAPGDIVMKAGAFADLPDDLIPCDGRFLSRELHPVLFGTIGVKYGAGDGQTSFQVPDLRDRFIVAARQDDAGIAETNLTGSLTTSGGARTASVAAGGGGANVAETGTPDGDLQVTVDPPYFALMFAIKGG